jgi:hypothetical protein
MRRLRTRATPKDCVTGHTPMSTVELPGSPVAALTRAYDAGTVYDWLNANSDLFGPLLEASMPAFDSERLCEFLAKQTGRRVAQMRNGSEIWK